MIANFTDREEARCRTTLFSLRGWAVTCVKWPLSICHYFTCIVVLRTRSISETDQGCSLMFVLKYAKPLRCVDDGQFRSLETSLIRWTRDNSTFEACPAQYTYCGSLFAQEEHNFFTLSHIGIAFKVRLRKQRWPATNRHFLPPDAAIDWSTIVNRFVTFINTRI